MTALTRTITDILRQTKREIDLVREYRTRLISDVVTGKLDVRHAAARHPDELDTAELPHDTDSLDDAEEDSVAEPDAALAETDA